MIDLELPQNPYEGGRNVLRDFDIPKSPRKGNQTALLQMQTVQLQSREDSCFPSYAAQQSLPRETQEAVRCAARDVLTQLLLPIIHVRRQQTKRIGYLEKFNLTEMDVAVEPFLNNPLFAPWTNLKAVRGAFLRRPVAFIRGEIVMYQHDISQSGVWYLASGTVEICNKRAWTSKSLGNDNRNVVATLRGPMILGEFAMLSGQPRISSVVCKSKYCLFFVLDKLAFQSLFLSMPESVQHHVSDLNYSKRVGVMRQAYHIRCHDVRKCAFFRDFPDDIVQLMIDNFVPLPVPRKGIVCAQGDEAENLFYIANGKVGVYRAPPDQCEPSTFVVKLSSGAIVGEMSLIVYQKRSATIIAFTSCDLFTLSKQTFQQLLTSVQGVQRSIIGKASVQQEKWMQQQKAHFLPYVQDIPFLKMLDLPQK
eukprot:PhF_6_TR27119/c0_g1_i4/m.39519